MGEKVKGYFKQAKEIFEDMISRKVSDLGDDNRVGASRQIVRIARMIQGEERKNDDKG